MYYFKNGIVFYICWQKSLTWKNINDIICHATHTYVNHKTEHEQLEEAYLKISDLETKIVKIETEIEKNQKRT